jgi:carbamoyltransferase
MRTALGIHVGHDRGACIIKDRKIVATLAQERLDRIKHSPSSEIPFQTIDALLQYCSLNITDISCIGLSYDSLEGNSVFNLYRDEFFNYYKCSYVPFYLVSHHEAHAYAVYFSSGFQDSLILIADGGGDFVNEKQESETMYIGNGEKVIQISRRLQNIPIRHMRNPINHIFPFMPAYIQNLELSLARKYSQITHLLGFGWGEDGKTMGLASYGKPLIDYNDLKYDELNFSLTYSDIIRELFVLQSLSGKSYKEFLNDERTNIASTVQSYVENSIISIVKSFIKKYQCKNLCVSGGLFLNCPTNHKIITECMIDNIFILPSSGDDGQALGSSYYAYIHQFGYDTPFDITLPYLGLSYTDEEVLQVINDKNLKYQKVADDDIAKTVAAFINENKIVALHRGRTETGPRALCHRSILANPTNPNMQNILNNRVKHRESFRPFAPTVIAEEQFIYFDLKCPSEYMLFASPVKEEYRNKLVAITHVDNTARIQAITKEKEPFIHSLLQEVKKLTGFPIVLNTSFNVARQPIVESPLDAVNTFLITDIDILVISNFVISKENMI